MTVRLHALMLMSLAVVLFALAGCDKSSTKDDNPCGGNPCGENPCGENPCAGNPCGENPCGENPCAGNPCNPCGGNPCGGGGAMADVADEDMATVKTIMGEWDAFTGWTQHNSVTFESPTHGGSFVNIYSTTDTLDLASYPEGTIVVKDGHKDAEASMRKMVWVMVKREAGYDAEYGDWFYAAYGADGSLMMSGNSSNESINSMCVSCHTSAADADYIFGAGDYQ